MLISLMKEEEIPQVAALEQVCFSEPWTEQGLSLIHILLPASLIYKMKKSRKHAVIGLAAGTVTMSVVAVFINALVLLPAYAKAFGMPDVYKRQV